MPETATTISTSVVLATFNGGARLQRMLNSMAKLAPPPGGWKLIIVDNASTDNTAQIIENYAERLPLLLLSHDVPGKNGALNKALSDIQGELIIFTDDDVIVSENWLIDYLDLANKNPKYAVFGGRIIPSWPSPPSKAILKLSNEVSLSITSYSIHCL